VGEGKWGCNEDSRDTNDYGRMNQPFNGYLIITWHSHLPPPPQFLPPPQPKAVGASPTHLLQFLASQQVKSSKSIKLFG